MTMPGPTFRKAVYGLSTALVPLLIVLGMEAHAAAAWVAAGLAAVNTVLAYVNVPGDPEGE